MKKITLLIVILFGPLFYGSSLFAQEVAPERMSKYVFELNAIKHQAQVDGVNKMVKEIENVDHAQLNWTDYQLVVHVKEGGNYGVFSLERLKAILIENKVDLKNFKKEELK